MKKLICVLLLIALCMPFAIAEENPFAFTEIPFECSLDEFLPQMIELYGGDKLEDITVLNTVHNWNGHGKQHLGRLLSYKPETMEVCGYTVGNVDVTELAADYDHSVRRMAHMQMYIDVMPGKEAEVYDILCQRISETFGSGLGNLQETQWVLSKMCEWSVNDTNILVAELWSSKRNGSAMLRLHYGVKDYQKLLEMMS